MYKAQQERFKRCQKRESSNSLDKQALLIQQQLPKFRLRSHSTNRSATPQPSTKPPTPNTKINPIAKSETTTILPSPNSNNAPTQTASLTPRIPLADLTQTSFAFSTSLNSHKPTTPTRTTTKPSASQIIQPQFTQQQSLSVSYLFCTRKSHQMNQLNMVCLNANCSHQGLLCCMCLEDHSSHRLDCVAFQKIVNFLNNHHSINNEKQSESNPKAINQPNPTQTRSITTITASSAITQIISLQQSINSQFDRMKQLLSQFNQKQEEIEKQELNETKQEIKAFLEGVDQNSLLASLNEYPSLNQFQEINAFLRRITFAKGQFNYLNIRSSEHSEQETQKKQVVTLASAYLQFENLNASLKTTLDTSLTSMMECILSMTKSDNNNNQQEIVYEIQLNDDNQDFEQQYVSPSPRKQRKHNTEASNNSSSKNTTSNNSCNNQLNPQQSRPQDILSSSAELASSFHEYSTSGSAEKTSKRLFSKTSENNQRISSFQQAFEQTQKQQLLIIGVDDDENNQVEDFSQDENNFQSANLLKSPMNHKTNLLQEINQMSKNNNRKVSFLSPNNNTQYHIIESSSHNHNLSNSKRNRKIRAKSRIDNQQSSNSIYNNKQSIFESDIDWIII